MAGERAAVRYAKAVLDLANGEHTAETVNKDMKLMAATIGDNKNLDVMLQNPVIRSATKKAVLLDVFKSSSKITESLIDTLITNKRLAILEEVAIKYNQLFDRQIGTEIAVVTTAVPITSELKATVLSKVKELTGNDVEVKNVIDESILGGFILRVGDIQYNASIANKLDKLKREFTLN